MSAAAAATAPSSCEVGSVSIREIRTGQELQQIGEVGPHNINETVPVGHHRPFPCPSTVTQAEAYVPHDAAAFPPAFATAASGE
jgi:hypothetical protein